MNIHTSKNFLYGLLAGFTVAIILLFLFKAASAGKFSKEGIAAEFQGEVLTYPQLRDRIAPNLVFIENDEYQALLSGADQWLNEKIVEKEARAEGVSVAELYKKNVWEQIQVTDSDVLDQYHKNEALYNQPFENVKPLLFKELRERKYESLKEAYLQKLREKYHAKIHLIKPKTYVEGLGIKPSEPSIPSGGQAPSAIPVPAPGGGIVKSAPIVQPANAPVKGPANAPVTVTEFADFHCGFCKKSNETMKQILQKYPSQVKLVFRHHPLSSTSGQGSFLTHEASVCAQDQGKFWEYADAAFGFQGVPQRNDLDQIAKNVGLNLNTFQDCLKSGKSQAFLQSELAAGNQRGIQGTPTFYVNEYEVPGAFPLEHFDQIIQSILTQGKTPLPSGVGSAGNAPVPPPPAIVNFDDLDGKPSRGPKKAPVTFVEFSDFFCPFCSRLEPTLDQVVKNYPDKVRIVWRHFPLPMHAGSDHAHEASECANEQGKFWEYHHKLFENQQLLRNEGELAKLAEEVGLNKKKFEKCLASGKYRDRVQKDIAKGNQSGVHGTPTIFVNGKLVSGAKPYESFEQMIKEQLAKT